jgi:hypothetical protein
LKQKIFQTTKVLKSTIKPKFKQDEKGNPLYYFGELKPVTNAFHGFGICIYNWGLLTYGLFLDGRIKVGIKVKTDYCSGPWYRKSIFRQGLCELQYLFRA